MTSWKTTVSAVIGAVGSSIMGAYQLKPELMAPLPPWVQSVGFPEPFNKVIKVVMALIALIICINVLLGLAGHPFIRW